MIELLPETLAGLMDRYVFNERKAAVSVGFKAQLYREIKKGLKKV